MKGTGKTETEKKLAKNAALRKKYREDDQYRERKKSQNTANYLKRKLGEKQATIRTVPEKSYEFDFQ